MATHTPAPFMRHITTNHPESSECDQFTTTEGHTPVGYDAASGPVQWQSMLAGTWFGLAYSADSRPALNDSSDVAQHEARHDSGSLGLTYDGGSVCRVVEWAPRSTAGQDQGIEEQRFMHRTASLDYGIVIFGEVELSVPGQPPRIVRAGDIVVQRGTMHAWRNASTTQPARMAFVLIASDNVSGPQGEQLGYHVPSLDKETAARVGMQEGTASINAMLRARRAE